MTLDKDKSTVSTPPEASNPPTQTSRMDEKADEAKKSEKLPAKSTEMDISESAGGTTAATAAAATASNTTKAASEGPKAMDIDTTESQSTKIPLKGATEASKDEKNSPMRVEKSVPQTGTKPDAPASTSSSLTPVQNVTSSTKSTNTETKTAINPAAASVAKTAVASTAAMSTTATTTVQVAPSTSTNPPTATTATVVTANRSVQQPKKKRKLNGENEEYKAVQQTVRDLIGLLQAYGPLTQGQIEYNLPPTIWPLQDILELLVALGIVQQVAPANSDADATADAATTTNTSTSTTVKPPDIQYCVCHGVPREETVLPDPHSLGHEIQRAHQQANNSFQRSQKLLHALQHPHEKKSTREVLRELLKEYPELTRDPVYFTAFRNCHIDVSGTAAASTATTTSGGRARGRGRSNANRSLADRRKSPKSARGAKIVTVSATATAASQKKMVGAIGHPVALKSPIPAAGTTTKTTASTKGATTTAEAAKTTTTATKVATTSVETTKAPAETTKATTEPSPASTATPKTVSAVPSTASATTAATPLVKDTEKEVKP